MKKGLMVLTALVVLLATQGCVTRKIPLTKGAESIQPISASQQRDLNCHVVGYHRVAETHPNNLVREIQNNAYNVGANRYRITKVFKTSRSRPSSAQAEFFSCDSPYRPTRSRPASPQLLNTNSNTVQEISFFETEQNDCQLITSTIIEKTSPSLLQKQLRAEASSRGGNSFHIFKILDVSNGQPSSVAADIYRCNNIKTSF